MDELPRELKFTEASVDQIVTRLQADPIIGRISRQAMSRLIAGAKIFTVAPNTQLITCSTPADQMLFITNGYVEALNNLGEEVQIHDFRAGDEIIAGFPINTISLYTKTNCSYISIPRSYILEAISNIPDSRNESLRLFSERLAQVPYAKKIDNPETQDVAIDSKLAFGWMAAAASPIIITIGLLNTSLPHTIIAFLAALTASTCMWIFSLVDEYIPLIFLMVMSIAYSIVPPEIALKGFGSESLLLISGVYALGIIIDDSGISYRIILALLNYLPSGLFWQRIVLMTTGFFFSPFLSSGNSRVAILQPLYSELLQSLDIKRKSDVATILATACFSGAMLLSPIFLTSKPSNLIVAEMLPNETKEHFTQLVWVQGALIAILILLIGQFASDHLIFGNVYGKPLPKSLTAAQSKVLGPLSTLEWIAVGALVFFVGAAVTTPLHNIPLSTISALLLVSLLMCGVISKSKFQQKVDWTTILFLLSIDSLVSMINYLGLQDYFVESIGALVKSYLGQNVYIFIFFEFILVAFIRLFLPITAGMIVASLLLMPLAPIVGISPWIVGFAAGVFSDIWFFSYQSSQYIQFRSKEGGEKGSYNESKFIKTNHLVNVARFLSIFISIPYWKWLGLI